MLTKTTVQATICLSALQIKSLVLASQALTNVSKYLQMWNHHVDVITDSFFFRLATVQQLWAASSNLFLYWFCHFSSIFSSVCTQCTKRKAVFESWHTYWAFKPIMVLREVWVLHTVAQWSFWASWVSLSPTSTVLDADAVVGCTVWQDKSADKWLCEWGSVAAVWVWDGELPSQFTQVLRRMSLLKHRITVKSFDRWWICLLRGCRGGVQ